MADDTEDTRSPQQKAADTRAANKAAKEAADTQEEAAEATKATDAAQALQGAQSGTGTIEVSDERKETVEGLQDALDDAAEEVKSNISEVDLEEVVEILDANASASTKYGVDFPGDVNDDGSIPDTTDSDAEQSEKEGKGKLQDDNRDSVFDGAPAESSDEALDAGGRSTSQGEESEHPDYVVGKQYALTVTTERTFTEIAARIGFPRPQEIAAINGVWDGRDIVEEGQRILLPQGYDYK